MANYTQFGSNAVPGGDFVFKNYGGSDIAAGLAVLADTTNVMGANAAAPGVVLPTASGGVVGTVGITLETIKAGGLGKVRLLGTAVGTANGSITAGAYVQASDTTSKLGWVKTCGAATEMVGQALNTASDGDPVLVLICKAKNALFEGIL